jgi:hypothetical protein
MTKIKQSKKDSLPKSVKKDTKKGISKSQNQHKNTSKEDEKIQKERTKKFIKSKQEEEEEEEVDNRPKFKTLSLPHPKQGNIHKNLINIQGIDRRVLLRKLWENAKPEMGYLIRILEDPSIHDEFFIDIDDCISKAKKENGRVDYAYGRFIKIYLFADNDNNMIDPERYDERWGKGSVQKIVNKIRNGR